MDKGNVLFAFLTTVLAGLATGVGGIIGVVVAKKSKSESGFLPFALGLSAGVMIYVSFVELLKDSFETLIRLYGKIPGGVYNLLGFFGGIALIFLIDRVLPDDINPHEIQTAEVAKTSHRDLTRVGLITAIGITVHNFPEGIATFASSILDPKLGIAIAIAIAIHNIPEGIAVAVPIYYSEKNAKKALKYSFLSGLAEPLGALLGMLVLMPFLNETVFAIMMSAVAGIMVFISLDELLPSAAAYGKHHMTIFGVVIGMLIMAITLVFI